MNNNKNTGFSLIEVLVIVTFASISLAVSIPNMTSFVYRQRLNTANREIYNAIRSTQAEAARRKETWQISFRQTSGYVEWARHHKDTPLDQVVRWHQIDPDIQIDQANTIDWWETNYMFDPDIGDYFWFLRFDHNGHFLDPDRRIQDPSFNRAQITLQLSNRVDRSDVARRCTVIETVIGAMRVEKDDNCR
ncbi:MAG: type II secretion system protein [Gloeocapsa sp. DLM2.Bin57]|nr:MAG: type II secretion system protein [Gloeocapsa sp. DLM2.Bin57]